MIRSIAVLAAALLLSAPAGAAEADRPEAYAVRIPVTPAPGGSLQQLAVPTRALVASQRAGLADLRIFDGRGQAVPIALSTAPAGPRHRMMTLPALPILGAAGTLAVTGVSLRIDEGQRASVVRVDGTPRAGAGAGTVVLGVLFDTRRLAGPVDALTLDAEVPVAQPVTFTIEASDDLQDWQPVACKTLYRADAAAAPEAIAFAAMGLHGRYLRVTWQAASRLVSPVVVRGARLAMVAGEAVARQRAVIGLPASAGGKAIEFALPFATPVAALEGVPTGGDSVVPVRILGRDARDQAWVPLAAGPVFRLTNSGRTRLNPPFDLHGARFRTLRIETDANSAGFAATPEVAVRFDPVRLIFLASSTPPFVLAAGRRDAPPVWLPAASLVPGYGPAADAALPAATTAPAADPVVAAAAPDATAARRGMVLWAVLLAGTALLGAMVWWLMRQRPRAA
ncbi:DUF3999 family protein [Sphingomonas solaris]|uniref:DUF3999 domain-containing protein n=1 Tax=Alterirhizorhabdus solaris TaxID=2529389 RepID=A0A558R5V4_9SPHN|nr:DUF3999 family protein [Sphingomonas solaris]TVV74718.1 DUF3999 domain-containing protein [Sphingomonas solaris]